MVSLPVLACAVLFYGCTGPHHRTGGERSPGALTVEVRSLLGYEGSFSAARIYVDGRFIGNYEPEKTVLRLPPGRYTVKVEVPRVYGRFNLNGKQQVRAFALTGEERIEVLGAESRQNLVFNDDNLKAKEIKHDGEQ